MHLDVKGFNLKEKLDWLFLTTRHKKAVFQFNSFITKLKTAKDRLIINNLARQSRTDFLLTEKIICGFHFII